MPYITEEHWQCLPQPKEACRKDSIMISEYPSVVQEWTNDQIENEMETVLDAVNKLRSLRPHTEIHERRPAFVLCRGVDIAVTIQCYQLQIVTLSSISSLKILTEDDPTPPNCATNIVNKDLSVYLQLRGAVNTEAECEKLRKKREETQKQHDTLSKKMNASGYREKAPQSKQDKDLKKITALLEELEIISEAESELMQTTERGQSIEKLFFLTT